MQFFFALGGGALFLGSLLYFFRAWASYGRMPEPWSASGAWPAIGINVALFTVFALHHSVFARTGAKAWVRARVPPALERSVYVWIASGMFIVVCANWQHVPGALWSHTSTLSFLINVAAVVLGVFITLHASKRIDMLELAGIRQVLPPAPRPTAGLTTDGLYGFVRHPIYLGWLLLVWPVMSMTGTRLVFAATSTLYLLIALHFEERTMRETLGAAYDDYARIVRWKIIPGIF